MRFLELTFFLLSLLELSATEAVRLVRGGDIMQLLSWLSSFNGSDRHRERLLSRACVTRRTHLLVLSRQPLLPAHSLELSIPSLSNFPAHKVTFCFLQWALVLFSLISSAQHRSPRLSESFHLRHLI